MCFLFHVKSCSKERYGLGGLFPSWWSWLNRARADLSIYIQEGKRLTLSVAEDYLEQLALAMAEDEFPKPLAQLVNQLLLQGRFDEAVKLETESI